MGSRSKSSGMSVVVVALGSVGIGISICIVFVAPMVWIAAEIWTLATPKPIDGFDLTDEEFADAHEWLNRLSLVTEEIKTIESTAKREDCRVRADGRWDERRHVARALNIQLDKAQRTQQYASDAHDEALSAPAERFQAWAPPRRFVWSLRFTMLTFVAISLAFPGTIAALAASFNGQIDASNILVRGLASAPYLASGLVAAVAGWIVGTLITGSQKPRSGSELFQNRLEDVVNRSSVGALGCETTV